MRFHDLRQSCASLLLANDVSLKEIQAWLGHTIIPRTPTFMFTLSTTQSFLRLK
ncbi:hypothetical protein [Paenibacillus oralis]|uniref:hypothetical protein n=1 Tax=Paenibacillus oralis TaxID=2490856 RepID=UPI001FEB9158|nr:hypothetical protein [Paenibacillus oralis]